MQSWPTKSNPATEKVLSLQFYQPCHTFTPVEEISLFHGQIQVRPHIGSTCRTPQSYTPSIASGSLTQVFGLKTLIPSLLDCKPLSVSHERRCAGNLISWQVPLTAVHNLHPHPKKPPHKKHQKLGGKNTGLEILQGPRLPFHRVVGLKQNQRLSHYIWLLGLQWKKKCESLMPVAAATGDSNAGGHVEACTRCWCFSVSALLICCHGVT